jgi:hypothetical protein
VLNIRPNRAIGFIICSRIGYGAYMAEVADSHRRRIESIFTALSITNAAASVCSDAYPLATSKPRQTKV